MLPLSKRLKDWQDPDFAQFHLGVVLGLFDDLRPPPQWVFGSDNSLANALNDLLQQFVKSGFLELNDEAQYRWASERVRQLLTEPESDETP
jgi:hypothetical protein